MKHGDLSNKGGIKLAFRIEDTLLKRSTDSRFSDFMRNFNKLYKYDIDIGVYSVIRRLYTNTDYNLILVTDKSNAEKFIVKDVCAKLPFCEVISLNRMSGIETNLITKEWEYYIDDNEKRRSSITKPTNSAVSLRDFLETCMRL